MPSATKARVMTAEILEKLEIRQSSFSSLITPVAVQLRHCNVIFGPIDLVEHDVKPRHEITAI